jgi:segregation and condensation protein A
MKIELPTVSLEKFEGTVDLLWHLIQNNEVDIYEVPIHRIIVYYLDSIEEFDLDSGAEFIAIVASLIWLKSKLLLPKHEQVTNENEQETAIGFGQSNQVEYSHFKEIAKHLIVREEKQKSHFVRGWNGLEESSSKNLGIEHVSLEELASLFQQVVAKASVSKGQILEETLKVGDKIDFLREIIKERDKIEFYSLFSPHLSREELIVIFLALLELMKLGELRVIKETATGCIFVASSHRK